MEAPTNIFMKQVYNSMKFSWRKFFEYHKVQRDLKKFTKEIMEGSPSFGVLWQFADFIKHAEDIYMFDNHNSARNQFQIYSSTGYNPGSNGFKIITKEYQMIVKLYSDDEKVAMDIDRLIGCSKKTHFTFVENQFTKEIDVYDEMFLDKIIKDINIRMIGLMNWCIAQKLDSTLRAN